MIKGMQHRGVDRLEILLLTTADRFRDIIKRPAVALKDFGQGFW